MRLADGSTAVITYRFTNPADRLSRSFFDASRSQSLTATPMLACPARLRDLVFLRTTNPKTGGAFTRLALVRLPGVRPNEISAHLDDAVTCYIADPTSLAGGGGQ